MRRSPKRQSKAPAGRTERPPLWLAALCAPADGILSHAVRRLARTRPEVFQRLGPHGEAIFHIAPNELPLAFQLRPSATSGRVQVKRKSDTAGAAATIEAPLVDLIGIFDGTLDADATFFSRRVIIEGRTEAVVALHNTLDAAELSVADLLGGGGPAKAAARIFDSLRRHAGERTGRSPREAA